MALELAAPVLAIVASDKDGLAPGKRLRAHHLRGSSALAYEADVVLVLNNKYDVVARHHLVYDTTASQRYLNYVVLTHREEPRRHGPGRPRDAQAVRAVPLRHRPRSPVEEQLVDERVFTD